MKSVHVAHIVPHSKPLLVSVLRDSITELGLSFTGLLQASGVHR